MKKCLTLCLFFSFTHSLPAQLEVKGLVTDRQSGEPVSFAGISLQLAQKNSLTNTAGRFSIRLQELPVGERILISAVGYQPFSMAVTRQLADSPLQIQLLRDVQEMETVVVTALKPKFSARKLMEKVIDKMYKNYAHNWYEMTAYFQTTTFHPWQEQHHLNLYEAVVKIQDRGFDSHADSLVYMELLKFRSGQDFLPEMTVSDSLTLSTMMKVITGQNHFNELFAAYTADVVRQQTSGMFAVSPFRNDAILNYDLSYDGQAMLDSIPCFRIISTHKDNMKEMMNKSSDGVPGLSYESYKLMFPEKTPEKTIDSLYRQMVQKFRKQLQQSPPSVSDDKDVFYVDPESFAVLRHERHTVFNNHYYGSWVNYKKQGKKYYPASMCKISPVLFRDGENKKPLNTQIPYALSMLIIQSVNEKKIRLIPPEKRFRSDAYLERVSLPYQPADWTYEMQIPFDENYYRLILNTLEKKQP